MTPRTRSPITAQAQARGLALGQLVVEKLEASTTLGQTGQHTVDQAVKNIRALRGGNILGANIKDLINEGRKY